MKLNAGSRPWTLNQAVDTPMHFNNGRYKFYFQTLGLWRIFRHAAFFEYQLSTNLRTLINLRKAKLTLII